MTHIPKKWYPRFNIQAGEDICIYIYETVDAMPRYYKSRAIVYSVLVTDIYIIKQNSFYKHGNLDEAIVMIQRYSILCTSTRPVSFFYVYVYCCEFCQQLGAVERRSRTLDSDIDATSGGMELMRIQYGQPFDISEGSKIQTSDKGSISYLKGDI